MPWQRRAQFTFLPPTCTYLRSSFLLELTAPKKEKATTFWWLPLAQASSEQVVASRGGSAPGLGLGVGQEEGSGVRSQESGVRSQNQGVRKFRIVWPSLPVWQGPVAGAPGESKCVQGALHAVRVLAPVAEGAQEEQEEEHHQGKTLRKLHPI